METPGPGAYCTLTAPPPRMCAARRRPIRGPLRTLLRREDVEIQGLLASASAREAEMLPLRRWCKR